MHAKRKYVCVCGARPNFMKVAPIVEALARVEGITTLLVHTGQHYDQRMSRLFFEELGIRRPDVNLDVGSGSHAAQTARVMERFEPVCAEARPDAVIVVGDVNSTMACAITAAKLRFPVAHVEAGLRSLDRNMPEEINRVVTDAVSDWHFVSEPSGVEHLRAEGIDGPRVCLVGNVMVDTLLRHRERSEKSDILVRLELVPGDYHLVTLHRPANVDDKESLGQIVRAIVEISTHATVVVPLHPRTRDQLVRFDLMDSLADTLGMRVLEPLGYLEFLKLMANARCVLTDSGGIQEETTALGIPCLTLRENTERPITISHGTNRLAGRRTETILAAYHQMRHNPPAARTTPPFWDGKTAQRIVARLVEV